MNKKAIKCGARTRKVKRISKSICHYFCKKEKREREKGKRRKEKRRKKNLSTKKKKAKGAGSLCETFFKTTLKTLFKSFKITQICISHLF